MPRESIYKRYKPSNNPPENNNPAYWFVFKLNELLIDANNNPINVPLANNLEEFDISPLRTQYMGSLNGNPCYSAEVIPGTGAPEGMVFKDLRQSYAVLDEDIYLLAGRAVQIINWDSSHQFCGKCSTPTETKVDEMAKVCPECGFTSHTRLSPAVITAIIKDGKLLMAKHSRGQGNRYGLIAGFVEAGETLEEAVKRETAEEVGLEINNIEYFGSQPWPYPNSLMIAFTAQYESGEIMVDGDEITHARWFNAKELPDIPSRVSVAGDLIDWYKNKYGN